MSPIVSIVIVSFNVKELLTDCIESIFQSNPSTPYEIIIVDNASTQPGMDQISLLNPSLRWIQNSENVGFAAANNQAIQIALGEFIWLLNPDTIIYPNSLDALVEAMRSNNKLGAAGSLLRSVKGDFQISCSPFPNLRREFVRLFHLEGIIPISSYDMKDWKLTEPHLVDNIQGASLLVRKSALDQIGELDENYFMYTEEVDLNFRLRKNNWLNVWVPASQILHYGGESTRQARMEMFLELYKTKIYFFRKHYGIVSAFLYKVILSIAALTRVLGAYLMNLLKKSQQGQIMLENYTHLLRKLPTF